MADMIQIKKGMFVRTEAGRVAEVINRDDSLYYGVVTLQCDPLGKRRHKHRERHHAATLTIVHEMEALAWAAQ